jgi:hypothetical protein
MVDAVFASDVHELFHDHNLNFNFNFYHIYFKNNLNYLNSYNNIDPTEFCGTARAGE